MPVFFKELRRNRLLIIIWSAASAFMLAVSLLIFPFLVSQLGSLAEMNEMLSAFGEDASSFMDYTGYFASEIVSVLGIGGAIFAALVGINALSREEREHTAEFLLTHPVPRSRVVLEKLLSVIVAVFVLNAVSALLSAAVSAAIGEKAEAGAIALTFLAHFILHIEIAAMTFMLSAFMSRGAVAAGLGVAFGTYVLYLIANITDKLRPLKYITPFGYAESGYIVANRAIHAGYLAVGLAITAVCIVLAFVRFCRKDFLS